MAHKDVRIRHASMQSLLRLLRGKYVAPIHTWTPSTRLPWCTSKPFTPSDDLCFSYTPILDMSPNRNQGMERLKTIFNAILNRRWPKERPGDATLDMCTQVILHLGAHNLQLLHSSFLPRLLSSEKDTKSLANYYLGFCVLKRIVEDDGFWTAVEDNVSSRQDAQEIVPRSSFEALLSSSMLQAFRLGEKEVKCAIGSGDTTTVVMDIVPFYSMTLDSVPRALEYTKFQSSEEVNVFTEMLNQQVASSRRWRETLLYPLEERTQMTFDRILNGAMQCSAVLNDWQARSFIVAGQRVKIVDRIEYEAKANALLQRSRNTERVTSVSEVRMWTHSLVKEAVTAMTLLSDKELLGAAYRSFFDPDAVTFIGVFLVSPLKEIANAVSQCLQQLVWKCPPLRCRILHGLLALSESCPLTDTVCLKTLLLHTLFLFDEWVSISQDGQEDYFIAEEEVQTLKYRTSAISLAHICSSDPETRLLCFNLLNAQDALFSVYQKSFAGLIKAEQAHIQHRMRSRYLLDLNFGVSDCFHLRNISSTLPDLSLPLALTAMGADQMAWTYYLCEIGRLCSGFQQICEQVFFFSLFQFSLFPH